MKNRYIVEQPFAGSISSLTYVDDQGVERVELSGSTSQRKKQVEPNPRQKAHGMISYEVIEIVQHGNKTVSELLADKPNKIVIDDAELDRLFAQHENDNYLNAKPKAVDRDRFMEMLEVLPPCRWGSRGVYEWFYVSEAYTSNIHTWLIRIDDRYFELYGRNNAEPMELVKRCEALV